MTDDTARLRAAAAYLSKSSGPTVLDLIRAAEQAHGTPPEQRVDAALPQPPAPDTARLALTALAAAADDMPGPVLIGRFREITGQAMATDDLVGAFADLHHAVGWCNALQSGSADPWQLLGEEYTGRYPLDDALARAVRMVDDALDRILGGAS